MQLREAKGPERKIQDEWIRYLTLRGWHVMETHGNLFMKGFPDLFLCHIQYGHRWAEIKNLNGYFYFTPAQLINFPKMNLNGSGVWVLGPVSDTEYRKLWCKPNWEQYLCLLK